MAKLTLTDGTIFEGTTEEIFAITERFNGVKAEAEALKVGDYVTLSGKSLFGVDLAGKVGVYGGPSVYSSSAKALVEVINEEEYVVKYADIRKATDEEVEDAKRKVDEATAKARKEAVFTQAGRKPNEYRKGDIVVVTDNHCAGGVSVGDIVEVGSQVSGGESIYDAKHGYMLTVSPITFVESRLDRN